MLLDKMRVPRAGNQAPTHACARAFSLQEGEIKVPSSLSLPRSSVLLCAEITKESHEFHSEKLLSLYTIGTYYVLARIRKGKVVI